MTGRKKPAAKPSPRKPARKPPPTPRRKPTKADAPDKRRIGPEACPEAMGLLAEGYSITSVAKRFGVTRETIYIWRDSPEGRQHLEAARKARDEDLEDSAAKARAVLQAGALQAAQTLVEATTSGPMKERIRASATILDRVGVPRTERVESAQADDEDLSQLSDEELELYERLHAKTRKTA